MTRMMMMDAQAYYKYSSAYCTHSRVVCLRLKGNFVNIISVSLQDYIA